MRLASIDLGQEFVRGALFVLTLTLGASASAGNQNGGPLEEQLRMLNSKRIFFGHHSVGDNILDGLRELGNEAGVPVRILELAQREGGPGVLHARVGENTKPLSKIDGFEHAMGSEQALNLEIAFFKFCYIDFDANTDVDAVFTRYVQMHEKVSLLHPGTRWVHVTVPLTVTQVGLKGYVKNLLGRAASGELENVKRHRFNELLRARFGRKEPIFDLARVEATREDGTLESFERDGRSYPRLVPEYSYDGEHLNEKGRQRAARALIELLASIP